MDVLDNLTMCVHQEAIWSVVVLVASLTQSCWYIIGHCRTGLSENVLQVHNTCSDVYTSVEHLVWKCVLVQGRAPLGGRVHRQRLVHLSMRTSPHQSLWRQAMTRCTYILMNRNSPRAWTKNYTTCCRDKKIRSIHTHSTQSCGLFRLSPQNSLFSEFVKYHCGHMYYMQPLIWFFLSVHGNQTSSVLILSLFLKLICQYLPQMWTDATYYTSLSVLAELFTR